MSVDETSVVSRSPSAPAVAYEDGLVVMSVGQGRFLRLDEVGRDIWERIERPRSLGELVDELAAEYDAPRASIAADVAVWVARMLAGGLIQLA